MSSKKQLAILISAFVTVLLFIAAVNYWFDPFGVFNKKQGWFSYQMTRNPRTAKISYLNHHHANYDSFILGSSGASGLVSASFDDGKYYNLFFYGADMKDIKQTAHYILDHYEVKQVILPITFSFAENYDAGNENLSYVMKPEVTGESPLAFYPQYLFSSLSYAYEMWQSQNKDSYLPKVFDVFVPESGNYDKRVRRVEYLGSLEEYLAKYPEFQHNRAKIAMPYMDAFFRDLEEVLNRFRDRGVEVKVVMYPLYRTAYRSYDPAEVRRFIDRLTDITDFYDFTYTRLSEEPRYFYDTGHYRNEVGDMMIRKMFGVEGYVPEDFGIYVEKGSAYSIAEPDSGQEVPAQANYERKIKVLILHHVDDEVTNSAVITEARLRELFDTIARKGYRVVRMTDIEAFVKHGVALPEKSVLLTFDDGYLSNYTSVYPLLKEYGYSAAFFPIGVSIGKDEYKDTGAPIIPHYSIEQMKEMKDSGLVEFGTHGFDVHQSAKLETGRARVSLLKWEDESEADYIEFLKSDFKRFELAVAPLDLEIRAMAYPLGEHDVLSDAVAVEQGIELSFTTRHGDTSLLKGLYQSMFNMNRINIDMTVDLDWVLD